MDEAIKISLGVVNQFTKPYNDFKDQTYGSSEALRRLTADREKAANLQSDLKQYDLVTNRLKDHTKKLNQAKQSTSEMGREIANTENPTKKQLADFEKSKKALAALEKTNNSYRDDVKKLNDELRANGVNTGDMSRAHRLANADVNKLTRSIDAQNKVLEKRKGIMAKAQVWQDRADKFGGYSQGLGTTSAAVGGLGMGAAVGVHAVNQNTVENARIAQGYGMDYSQYMANDSVGSKAGLNGESIADLQEEMKNKLGEMLSTGKNGALEEFADYKGGFDFKAMQGMSGEDQFKHLTDSIAEIQDSDKRQFFYDSIMGGEGAKLSRSLDAMGMSYTEAFEGAKKYNLTTKEGIDGARAYGDAYSTLSRTTSSAVSEVSGLIGGVLAPEMLKASTLITDLFQNNKDEIKQFTGEIANSIASTVSFVVDNASTIATIAEWGSYLMIASTGVKAVSFAVSGVSTAISIATKASAMWTAASAAASIGMGAMSTAGATLNAVLLANPIGAVVVGVGALIAAGVLLYKNWETVTSFMSTSFNAVTSGLVEGGVWMGDQLSAIFDRITSMVMAPINLMKYAMGLGGELMDFVFGEDEKDESSISGGKKSSLNEKAKIQAQKLNPSQSVSASSTAQSKTVSTSNQYSFTIQGSDDPQRTAMQVRAELEMIERERELKQRGALHD